jgi:hypothetical protein
MTWSEYSLGGRVNAAEARNDCDRGRRRLRSTNSQHGNRYRLPAHSGLAAFDAADRVVRELDWTSLNRPGRGVPPPRSGPLSLGVT